MLLHDEKSDSNAGTPPHCSPFRFDNRGLSRTWPRSNSFSLLTSIEKVGLALFGMEFNLLLDRRLFEKEDEWRHAKHDAARQPELIHVGQQVGLALHCRIKLSQCSISSVGGITGVLVAEVLLHQLVRGGKLSAKMAWTEGCSPPPARPCVTERESVSRAKVPARRLR